MAFWDELLANILSPEGIGKIVGGGLSLAGGLMGRGQPQTVTSNRDSAFQRALLGEAKASLPTPLSAADIERERTAASMKGRDFAAARGFQAPGAPFTGMANTISDESAFNAGLAATRFNKELGLRNAASLTGMGNLAPTTQTTTTTQRPDVFNALTGTGQALAGLFPQKKKQPFGVFQAPAQPFPGGQWGT